MIDLSTLQAVFVDRDGVINRERADYVRSWREFVFLPGALEAMTRLAFLGAPVLVLTNQSAIGRGYVSAVTVDDIHARMRAAIAETGGRVDRVYLCPHHPDEGCTCRKPAPGLLFQAAQDYGLDLDRCVFIGDSVTDAMAADAAGAQAILVRSGRQGDRLEALIAAARQSGSLTRQTPPICDDLNAAVALLRRQSTRNCINFPNRESQFAQFA